MYKMRNYHLHCRVLVRQTLLHVERVYCGSWFNVNGRDVLARMSFVIATSSLCQ